jgi:CelD/BcsL family acetyltransferase involved in cellulose biosynthesis
VAHHFSSEADALVAPRAPARRDDAGSAPGAVRQPEHGAITVEIASGDRLIAIDADWRDLITRADVPNVFMHPALVRLASHHYAAPALALLAWQWQPAGERLVGVWAFKCARAPQSILPVTVLSAPPMPNAYLATPVIDRGYLDEALAAMLDRIAGDAALPKIIALEAMTIDGATMQALAKVLAARGSPACVLNQRRRPRLASTLDGKQYLEQALSGGSRKKLRQQRRRLGERGRLEFRVVSEPAAVCAMFENFLATEAAAWKGRLGTALSSHPADAAFARAMIAALAPQGEAAIYILALDGRPVSLQVVLRAGSAAYTWKTAYDERLHDYSPGMLLFEDYTAALLADERIAYADSCTFDDTGFMAAWRERQAIAAMWIDTRRNASLAFAALCRTQKAYIALRTTAKQIYRGDLRRRRSRKA